MRFHLQMVCYHIIPNSPHLDFFSSDPDLKYAIATKFAQLRELGAAWQTATASLPSKYIQPWNAPVRHSNPRHRRVAALSETNHIDDDEGSLCAESSDDDSTNSVDGVLDPVTEFDITIGDTIDRDTLRYND
jgi:hypothetical protein